MNTIKINLKINAVAETAFITLYSHALDALSKEPILNDTSAVKIVKILNRELSKSDNQLYQRLVKGKLPEKSVIHIAIRAKKYDEYVREYIEKYPEATIVNIGCGLDHRFERIDNDRIKFFDLDFPDIIEIKRQFFKETNRFSYIAQSVFDFNWMDRIKNKDVLFLAEGVFMYCDKNDVKTLFVKLQNKFPGAEMVCEVFNSMWLKGWLKKVMSYKLQKKFDMNEAALFRSGIKDSQEIESWNQGLRFLGDWSYFDSNEKKLGWLKIFRVLNIFRKTQWTVHYQLGEKINT